MSMLERFRSFSSRVDRRELLMLAALAVPAALLSVFLNIASEIVEGESIGFDRAILLALRTPGDPADPIGPRWLEIAIKDITSLGSTAVLTLITFAALGYLLTARKRGAALLVAVSIGGGTLLNMALKHLFARPRPDFVAHVVEASNSSFPSGHAMLSAITFLTLGALLARVESNVRVKVYVLALAVVTTVLVGASRVYLGVHYPSDVLAGWAIGAAWAIACWQMAWWLQRRGDVENGRAATPRNGRRSTI